MIFAPRTDQLEATESIATPIARRGPGPGHHGV